MTDKESTPVSRPDRKADFHKPDEVDRDKKVSEKKGRPSDEGKFADLMDGEGKSEAKPLEERENIFGMAKADKEKPVGALPVAKSDEPEVVGEKIAEPQQKVDAAAGLPGDAPRMEMSMAAASSSTSAAATADMKSLAANIGDQFVQVKSAEQTETLITIKHPPSFAGATVKLTEHASAPGEYNVTFANLGQQAKTMLDLAPNQDSLRMALDAKGIPIHIVTTKTEADTLRGSESSSTASRGDKDEEEDEERQG